LPHQQKNRPPRTGETPVPKENIECIAFNQEALNVWKLAEEEDRQQYGNNIYIKKREFAEVDRAQAEATTKGFAKIIAKYNGRILGVHLVGAAAGELI
jgi:pyruvate/2-oxoglutarate dehydrogenase complex dihydrolipoamide dehydrogenase (E3) component